MNISKTTRLNLEQPGDRILPSAVHFTDTTLIITKIAMTAPLSNSDAAGGETERHSMTSKKMTVGLDIGTGEGSGGGAGKVTFVYRKHIPDFSVGDLASGKRQLNPVVVGSGHTTAYPDDPAIVDKWFYGADLPVVADPKKT